MRTLSLIFSGLLLSAHLLLAQENTQGNNQQKAEINRFVHYTSKVYKTRDGLYLLRRQLIIRDNCKKGDYSRCTNSYLFVDEDGNGSYDQVKVRLGENYSTSRIVGKELENKINKEIINAVNVQKQQLKSTLDKYLAGNIELTVTATTIPLQSTTYRMVNDKGPDFLLTMERPSKTRVGDTVKFIALGTNEGGTNYNVEIWTLNRRMLAIIGKQNKITHDVATSIKDTGKELFEKLRFDHGQNVGKFPNINTFGSK